MKLNEDRLIAAGGEYRSIKGEKRVYITPHKLCDLLIKNSVNRKILKIKNRNAVIYLDISTSALIVNGQFVFGLLRKCGIKNCWDSRKDQRAALHKLNITA